MYFASGAGIAAGMFLSGTLLSSRCHAPTTFPLLPLPTGIAAGVFLGGTLLFSMWKVSRDPEQRRRKTMNKNKASTCGGVLCRVRSALPPAACWLG